MNNKNKKLKKGKAKDEISTNLKNFLELKEND